MVTITYAVLDDMVHDLAETIEKKTGIDVAMLDLFRLNTVLVSFLDDYGVQYEDELGGEV